MLMYGVNWVVCFNVSRLVSNKRLFAGDTPDASRAAECKVGRTF